MLLLPYIILFNVHNRESWEIMPKGGAASLRKVVEKVLRAKYSTRGKLTTDEFLKKYAKITIEVDRY